MSYEGSIQILCEQGHQFFEDCYEGVSDDWRCCFCGTPVAFRWDIDETNGTDPNDPRTMPVHLIEVEEPVRMSGMRIPRRYHLPPK